MSKAILMILVLFGSNAYARIKFELNKNPDPFAYNRAYTTPTELLEESKWPSLDDDLDFKNLDKVLYRQILRFSGIKMNGTIRLGDQVFPLSAMKESLLVLQKILSNYKNCIGGSYEQNELCKKLFFDTLKSKFNLYKPIVEGNQNFTHFTAYHTPILQAALEPIGALQNGIYKKPIGDIQKKYTRAQIYFDKTLEDKNLNLVYTKDLFEIYLLHVEGGGKALLSDGSSVYLSYNGTNRKTWNFISLYMRDKGYIDDLSIHAQRSFLIKHPELARDIYEQCPSYVFFKFTQNPPIGSDNVPLTDNRSIATDKSLYAMKGLISIVSSKRLRPSYEDRSDVQPTEGDFIPFTRIMVDQDTGGAIKGSARVDLYFGEDAYAQKAAQYQNHMGEVYFLMLKN
ncbi:MAG: MltA domain-containing protein [Bdellovibrionales bacterium]|nr:MltA domain-containing protein [Bdellovibrionales bacterium]